jgi:hypothetical protein
MLTCSQAYVNICIFEPNLLTEESFKDQTNLRVLEIKLLTCFTQ